MRPHRILCTGKSQHKNDTQPNEMKRERRGRRQWHGIVRMVYIKKDHVNRVLCHSRAYYLDVSASGVRERERVRNGNKAENVFGSIAKVNEHLCQKIYLNWVGTHSPNTRSLPSMTVCAAVCLYYFNNNLYTLFLTYLLPLCCLFLLLCTHTHTQKHIM